MKKIILIAGYCATGKSTFARRLSQELKIPCFCKDTLKEAMAGGITATDARSAWLYDNGSAATGEVMMHIAQCILKAGGICILEANFRLTQAMQIEALAKQYHAECLTFLFHGDVDVLWDRYVNRENDRHWVHMTSGEGKAYFIQGHLDGGMGEIAVGQTVRVDATDFGLVDYEKLIEVAGAFVNRQGNP